MIIPPVSKPDSPSLNLAPLASACGTRRGAGAGKGAASAPPRDASLGTTAKSSVSTDLDDPETRRKASRALRYQGLSQARHVLRCDALKVKPDGFPGDVHRTADCRHLRHSDINVMRSLEHGTAFYSGLVTCGSVWSCPVCAARIQERRRLEIEQAIAWAESLGLVCVLVTFTFPHSIADLLSDLIPRQRDAFKRLRETSRYRKLKPVALIRSLELTYSERNGWHPHTHELWFCEPDKIPSRVRLTDLWYAACLRAGLVDPDNDTQAGHFNIYAVDVKRDMTCGDYLAKQDDSRSWGFSHEVAKATSKAGRRKGFHPHHLLVRGNPGDDALFLEYHKAMKGARQLFWSPGLKARVGLVDLSDEVIADESRDPADLLAHVPDDAWRIVRSNDAHAELLDAAETGGASAVHSFLVSLGWSPLPQ